MKLREPCGRLLALPRPIPVRTADSKHQGNLRALLSRTKACGFEALGRSNVCDPTSIYLQYRLIGT